MTELEILQDGFHNMSRKFPGLMHIVLAWRNTEKEPELTPRYVPTEETLIASWGNGLIRKYTPELIMKHWLIKPHHLSWSKDQARDHFLKLAEKSGRILCEKKLMSRLKLPKAILKFSKSKLTSTQYSQLWTLVVHFLGDVERYANDPRDIKTCWTQILDIEAPDKYSLHSFYEVQKDISMESSLVITQILSAFHEPLSDKALAVLDLLQNLPPNKGLTGPKILDELAMESIFLDQSTLTKSIIPALEAHGVKNKPRIGYYIQK